MTRPSLDSPPQDNAPDDDLLDHFIDIGLEQLEREDAAHRAGEPALGPVRPATRSPLLVAAALLLGTVATLAVKWSVETDRSAQKASQPQDPKPDQAIGSRSKPRIVSTLAEAAALSAQTRAVRAFDPDDKTLQTLATLRHLQFVEVVYATAPPESLIGQLATLPAVQGLYIEVDDESLDLRPLDALPTLRRLSLHGVQFRQTDLAAVTRLPQLQELDLRGCKGLTTAHLEHIGQLPGLRWLGLTPSEKLAIADLTALANKQRITSLILNVRAKLAPDTRRSAVMFMTDVTNARSPYGLESLTEFSALTYLSLRASRELPGEQIRHLRQLENLRALDLAGCKQVTGEHLQHLPAAIEQLDLSSTRWDQPLPSRLTKLQTLNGTRAWLLDDAALQQTLALPALRHLNLKHCPKLTAASVEVLGTAQLTELDLACSRWLGDEQMPHLAKATSLTRLRLSGSRKEVRMSMGEGGLIPTGGISKITDAGIEHLAKLSDLQWLEIEDLPPLQQNAVSKLAALPLRVLGVGGTQLIIEPAGDNDISTPAISTPATDAWRILFPNCRIASRPETAVLERTLRDWKAYALTARSNARS